MEARIQGCAEPGCSDAAPPTQERKRDRLTHVFRMLGAARGGTKSRIGTDDWAMELGGSDAQYDDRGEHFWAAFADCRATWAMEPSRLFHRVCGSGSDRGVFGGGGVVFSGSRRAISVRPRGFWAICWNSDRMAYVVVAYFGLLGCGESFHYVSDGVCACGEKAVGASPSADCADWSFGGG